MFQMFSMLHFKWCLCQTTKSLWCLHTQHSKIRYNLKETSHYIITQLEISADTVHVFNISIESLFTIICKNKPKQLQNKSRILSTVKRMTHFILYYFCLYWKIFLSEHLNRICELSMRLRSDPIDTFTPFVFIIDSFLCSSPVHWGSVIRSLICD